MADYSIETDPYLSTSIKSRLAQHKAEGVDLSRVEQFLRDTAHLVEPIPVSPIPRFVRELVLLLLAAVAILCGILFWLLS